MRASAGAAAWLWAVSLALACGRPAAPGAEGALSLARGFEPAPLGLGLSGFSGALRVERLEGSTGEVRVTAEIPPSAWRLGRVMDHWVCEMPLAGVDTLSEDRLWLEIDGRRLPCVAPPNAKRPAGEEPAIFLTDGRIHLLPAGRDAPASSTLVATIDRGAAREGVWRTWVGGLSGEGIPVWPGAAVAIPLPTPSAGRLTYLASYRPLLARAAAPPPARDGTPAGKEGRGATFRVLLEGTVLDEHEEDAAGRGTFRSIAIPAGASARTLTLEVTAEPGLAAFFLPRFHRGGSGRSPWAPEASDSPGRPDLVLFLADTFRADNLSFAGGAHGAAPNLDRLAAGALRFPRAWSTAAWTLPAQVSALSGVLPPQHGAVDKKIAFASGLESLAEVLAGAGYRTAAITDSGFISRSFGFDQGFELFRETPIKRWDLSATLSDALDYLDQEDERPAFVFVHTYRTHLPYRRGVEEDVAPWHELVARATQALRNEGGPVDLDSIPPELVAAVLQLYLDGVAALDEEVGGFLAALEQREFFERGCFLFTSDHGEAFREHGELFHGGVLWEEKIRIPLFLTGTGVQSGVCTAAASLVDLPPTLAALARVDAAETWVGRSLLDLAAGEPEPAPVLAFGDELAHLGPRVAIVSGDRKVFARNDPATLADGGFERAFDLGVDPGEASSLGPADAEWPAELCRELAPALAAWNRRLVDPPPADLSAEERARLAALGYGGEDAEEPE